MAVLSIVEDLSWGKAEFMAIALNLLKQNISLEIIFQATGLTIAQLQQLQNDQPPQ